MKEKIELNHQFVSWLNEITLDLMTTTIEDEPAKVPVFVAVNDMLNKIGYDGTKDLSKILGDDLIEKIINEIKSNI